MLTPHDRDTPDLWSGQCSGCLAAIPITPGTRAEAEAVLRAAGWEIRTVDSIWCVHCSRKAREVPFPLTSRGMKRRSR